MSINFDNFNNIVSMFFEQAKKMKDKPYLWKKNNDKFESLSWGEVELSVKSVARSLIDLGILKGDRVIILSENRPEWQIADLAIMSIGAITVPVYTTSTTADYSHIINHSGARCMIISSHELCLKALPAIESSTDCKNVIKINDDSQSYNNPVNIMQWSNLVEKNSDDAWYMYYLRGICYERSDNWDKAEKDFIESLKLKRNSPDVLNYLAYGWIERNMKIDESFVMLTDAYNANPDSYYILDSLAWVYYKKKDYKKAAELMEEVIDMVPGEAISLDHLGDIYYAMNRKREASFFWKQAKDLASPEDGIIEKIEKKLKEYNAT